MGGTLLALWLLAGTPAAPPVPMPLKNGQPPKYEPADDAVFREAGILAEWVADTAEKLEQEYVRPVKASDLLVAAMSEIYQDAGLELPVHFRDKLRNATNTQARAEAVSQARIALGRADPVEGMKSVVIAAEGFRKLTDSYCGLMITRAGAFASSDAEYGLGFELEGATGSAWVAYQLELSYSVGGRRGGASDPFAPPATLPWTVRRVIPGSPAAAAGLRPGDVITHLDGDEITPRSATKLFQRLVNFRQQDPRIAPPPPPLPSTGSDERPLKLTLSRQEAGKAMELKVDRTPYIPDSIFGVMRKRDGSWDFMLDRENKVGYIRVGSVETGADAAFRSALDGLIRDGATGLLLDLRWCPGGYVDPTAKIAGLLLPSGKTIVRIESRHPERQNRNEYLSEPGDAPEAFRTLPVAVLIGSETTGGGEMIAAALRDHGRAILVGQRTFGKANILSPLSTRFPGITYRISTGYSLRPNGKNRHRFPDSKPTDDWGLRPDPGCEVPVTKDLSAKLRESAERQAIRPPQDRIALAFDDPLGDPQKLIAAKLLKERGKEK